MLKALPPRVLSSRYDADIVKHFKPIVLDPLYTDLVIDYYFEVRIFRKQPRRKAVVSDVVGRLLISQYIVKSRVTPECLEPSLLLEADQVLTAIQLTSLSLSLKLEVFVTETPNHAENDDYLAGEFPLSALKV